MKRFLSVLLTVIVLLSLFAGCSEGSSETTEGTKAHTLRVGFGRVDITPEESVPLGGYGVSTGANRLHTQVLDPLYATCIAFTDENDNTVLLFHLDACTSASDAIMWARSDVSKATGVPFANVIAAATHTHSAPYITRDDIGSIERYNQSLREWMKEAALAAMEDRKEAEIYTAETYPEGYNFVRHYELEDGEVMGDGFGSRDGRAYVGHVSEADHQLQLLKFTREGAEDIVLMNWQTHPHITGGSTKYDLSADLVGAIRMYMEDTLGCKFAYFNGAGGNINPSSRIKGEEAYTKGDYLSYGNQFGQIAVEALENCTPLEKGNVQMLNENISLETKSAGLREVTLSAFSIGDVGFACAPYEMFDTNGVQIKTGSQFARTFIVGYANGSLSYIPSIGTYEYARETDTDQVYEIMKCQFVPGTGEKLAEQYVSMLNRLCETAK